MRTAVRTPFESGRLAPVYQNGQRSRDANTRFGHHNVQRTGHLDGRGWSLLRKERRRLAAQPPICGIRESEWVLTTDMSSIW
jgi:hypothetical protein